MCSAATAASSLNFGLLSLRDPPYCSTRMDEARTLLACRSERARTRYGHDKDLSVAHERVRGKAFEKSKLWWCKG